MMTISRYGSPGETKVIMSTFMAKPGQVPRRWWLIDATDQVVGRLAVTIANILRGKHRPEYTPHIDTGEFVIVVNAEKVRFTGKKLQTKTYRWYTGYPGGLKEVAARDLMQTRPERILLEAVRRMVPRNRLGRRQMSKLKVYRGPTHEHQAQQPQEYKLS